jgi:hypothetical protein
MKMRKIVGVFFSKFSAEDENRFYQDLWLVCVCLYFLVYSFNSKSRAYNVAKKKIKKGKLCY